MNQTAVIPFISFSGREYELTISYDPLLIAGDVPIAFEEGPSGEIFPVMRVTGRSSYPWDSISEMTHSLKLEIVSWGSDIGN
jgi:hypothetical protein